MRCKCGFQFSDPGCTDKDLSSYALIRDADYAKVMTLETKYLSTAVARERMKLIGRSAPFVGTVRDCPECACLVVLRPDRGKEIVEYYTQER